MKKTLEDKIKALLEGASEEIAVEVVEDADPSKLKPGVGAKEDAPMKQGSSKDAETEDLGSTEPGKVAAAKAKKMPVPTATGAGAAPNFTTTVDPTSVINMSKGRGNLNQEELEAIFPAEANLSEEFKTKAQGIFEAVVVARVAEEVEKVTEELNAQLEQAITEEKASLVEKLDQFLNYVAEAWLEANEVAITEGLKAEITEDFMTGLKALFAENYVEIPEGKFDVLQATEAELAETKETLNAKITESIELVNENLRLRKDAVLVKLSEGLAKTEAEKLRKLTEGVSFDSEELFAEKITVIRESTFPKAKKIVSEDLTEDVTPEINNSSVSKYASAIRKTF